MSRQVNDLTGKRFGRLSIMEYIGNDKSNNNIWRCKCDCGNEIYASSVQLTESSIKSCGCLLVESMSKSMMDKQFAYNGKTQSIKQWSKETGISYTTLYNRLKNGQTIKEAIEMPIRKKKDNIELLTYNGKTQSLKQWSEETGISYQTLAKRLSRGQTLKEAIETPMHARKTNIKLLTYNGKTQSLSQWSEEAGISYQTLVHRLSRGQTLKEALETPIDNRKKLLSYNGKTQTLKRWSEETGISYQTLAKRLSRGQTLKEAIETPMNTRKTNIKLLTYNGKTQSLTQWSEETGISYQILARRIRKGNTLKEAIETPIDRKKLLTYNGKTQTLKHWSEETGIGYQTLLKRIRKGQTLQEAIETPIDGRKKPLNYNGKTQSLSQWSEETGINYQTLLYRIKKGESIKEAIEMHAMKVNTKSLTYNGKTQTLKQWSKETGINYQTLLNRIKKGKTLQEAIETSDNRKKLLTYNGKTQTLKQWSAETGIGYRTLISRLNEGYTPEEILKTAVRHKNIILTYNGKTQTLKQWSEETGIGYQTILNRLRKGYTPKEVLDTSVHIKKENINLLTHDGKSQTLKQWSKEIGISCSTIYNRLKRGQTLGEIIDMYTKKVNTRLLTYKGKTQSLKQWSKETGINYQTLLKRIRKGMTLQEAIETPIKRRRKLISYNGKKLSLSELSEQLGGQTGLNYNVLATRLRKGMTLQEAIEKPIKKQNVLEITYNGKTQSLMQWSKETGISYDVLWHRLNSGQTPEEAIETPTRKIKSKK